MFVSTCYVHLYSLLAFVWCAIPTSSNASRIEPDAKLKEIICFLICVGCVDIFGSIIRMVIERYVRLFSI